MAARVLFYVQHLLGIGHLKRATTIARAMAERGLEVTLVSGGENESVVDETGMTFVQLPPIRAQDRRFQAIVDANGEEITDDLKQGRRDQLVKLYESLQPSALIIELFPFGRRALRFELLPLLEAARASSPRPVVISSVRDILVEKNRPERQLEMVETVERYFDKVLVHGDPNLIAFDATFPKAKDIEEKLNYTGYVVDQKLADHPEGTQGTGEIIVSSGSGRVGEILLRTALDARAKTSVRDRPWRYLAGNSLPEEIFAELANHTGDGVIVERARPDFVTLLANCHLSISQGGYNTIMEVLAARARGVSVPYAGGQETEQTLRTGLLAERGLLFQIPEADLTVSRLVDAVENALISPRPNDISINMSGAEESARLVAQWIG
ncbi:MAG: glycosyltransferase [Proteobacteria bacterium]|nr:glycosyltransferase [Pseudomonadota bacterium]